MKTFLIAILLLCGCATTAVQKDDCHLEFISYGDEWPKMFYVQGDICKEMVSLTGEDNKTSMTIERVCQ